MRRERALKPDASGLPKPRKPTPHAFVLDAISTLSPYTRPMFGCLAIYVKDKIVLIRGTSLKALRIMEYGSPPPKNTIRACGVTSRTCDPFKYWANA
jgi:hypothetical protein